jgi:hypothetical protein
MKRPWVVRVEQRAGQRLDARVVAAPVQQPVQQDAGRWLQQTRDAADKFDAQPGDAGDHDQQHDEAAGDLGGEAERGAEHHARQDIGRCPEHRGDHIHPEESRDRHFHHAGNGRHDRAHRTDKARHENALATVAEEEIGAAVYHRRVTPQRPHDPQSLVVVPADQETDGVAGNGAADGPEQDR